MKRNEMQAIIHELSDTVHDLLRNTEEDDWEGLPQGSSDQVRVCLDIPRAWLVLAAWLERTHRARRHGEHSVARNFIDPVGEIGIIKPWARQYLWELINDQMHLELHGLTADLQGFLQPPPQPRQPRPEPPEDIEGTIPF